MSYIMRGPPKNEHSRRAAPAQSALKRPPFKILECRATALPPAAHGPSTQPPRAYYSIII